MSMFMFFIHVFWANFSTFHTVIVLLRMYFFSEDKYFKGNVTTVPQLKIQIPDVFENFMHLRSILDFTSFSTPYGIQQMCHEIPIFEVKYMNIHQKSSI